MKYLPKLPKMLRYLFTLLCGLSLLGAVLLSYIMLFPPLHSKSVIMQVGDLSVIVPKGAVELHPRDTGESISVTRLDGKIFWHPEENNQHLTKTVNRIMLPAALLSTLAMAFLCDLFRRLFLQVEQGNYFTIETLRLVQRLGTMLLIFSLINEGVGWWLSQQFADLFQTQSASSRGITISLDNFLFGQPAALSGLIVLALSEVFRQGLALKRENDLTV